ncbi:hypothetical protein K6102_14210 [Vibrio furnissii]|uniref:hypothetical protein n=1 Tax=Vibrio furnissii TaxID=29494 RepID=UPI001EEAA8EB|nr:hypothetical protein [Vibrio furnissii]MCG6234168.1 hypothetical protein [Vibrio furnissii]
MPNRTIMAWVAQSKLPITNKDKPTATPLINMLPLFEPAAREDRYLEGSTCPSFFLIPH